MSLAGRPAARVLLRAVLLGAGAVGGYLLLSAFAGPANADSDLLGGGLDPVTDQVTDVGSDLGGLLDDLPLPEREPEPAEPVPAEPDPPEPERTPPPAADDSPDPAPEPAPEPEPAAAAEPDREPPAETEPTPVADLVESVAAPATRGAAELTNAVTEVVAGAESALPVAGPLREATELVAELAGTVESTLDPLTTTVDSLLPAPTPEAEHTTVTTILPSPGSLLDPIAPIMDALAPPDAAPTVLATTTSRQDARDGPDPPGDPPAPPRAPPRLLPTSPTPGGHAPEPVRASADNGEPAPDPAMPPVPSTQQLAAQSFDHGQPWPLARPADAAGEPDLGLDRSLQDVAYTGLVMSISAPPG